MIALLEVSNSRDTETQSQPVFAWISGPTYLQAKAHNLVVYALSNLKEADKWGHLLKNHETG